MEKRGREEEEEVIINQLKGLHEVARKDKEKRRRS